MHTGLFCVLSITHKKLATLVDTSKLLHFIVLFVLSSISQLCGKLAATYPLFVSYNLLILSISSVSYTFIILCVILLRCVFIYLCDVLITPICIILHRILDI